MTADEVTTIIDQLCDKLGLAVSSMSELVPELARMKIAQYTYASVILLILAAIIIPAIIAGTWWYGKKWVKRQNEKAVAEFEEDKEKWPDLAREHPTQYTISDNDAVGIIILCAVICLIFAVAALVAEGWNLVKWYSSPTAAAIEYILSLM